MTGKDWADLVFGLLVVGLFIGGLVALKGWW